jgi:predicted acylesterase/phospholipase RssA
VADALVIAGAVLKGSFAAGALAVLSDPSVHTRLGVHIRRIVGTSSGALNAAYYAAAIHAGQELQAGDRLAELWVNDGGVLDSIAPSARAVLARRGVSSTRKIAALLRASIAPSASRRPVSLRLIATNLCGERVFIDGRAATTHEHVFSFEGADLATREGVDRLFDAVAASAAFPGIFEPVQLRVDGRTSTFVDGGAVNDAPIGYALDGDLGVDRVFIITPNPRVERQPCALRGFAYAAQLADILLDERLVRDLAETERINGALVALDRAEPDPARRAKVLAALGWEGRRVVRLVEIRPDAVLPGSSFSGWFSKSLRRDYVAAGREAAERVLSAL